MFVADEMLIAIPALTAADRLDRMACCGRLAGSATTAYEDGLGIVIRVGPFGDVPFASKLVRVQVLDLARHDGKATLAIRWEATGSAGSLFPVLDADISVARVDENTTRLELLGSYRPPLSWLGAGLDHALLRRVALATVRSLLRDVAAALAEPAEQGADLRISH